MPSTGGYSPSPTRYGGAPGKAPRLQRIVESLQAQRGTAYDQGTQSSIFVEDMAYARAIEFDGYGANERLANNFLPSKMTAIGLLPRWEKILGLYPLPTDTEPTRRARVAAAWARFGGNASDQPLRTALQNALGAVYVGLSYVTPSNDLAFWPGNNGNAASVINSSSTNVTVTGLSGVSGGWYGALLTLSNCANSNNNITNQQIVGTPSSVTVVANDPAGGTNPDYGVGGTIGSPTIVWSVTSPTPQVNWTSTIAHVLVQVTQPANYTLAQFYAAIGTIAPIMEQMLPAWATYDWWYVSPFNGLQGFILDDPANLDGEAFDV